ncbi:hypothetical protein [Nocardia sp. NPDC004260]
MTDNRKHLETTPPLNLALEVTCDTCDQSTTLHVNRDQFAAWAERRLAIQNAFAHLNPPEREYIKSRICPSCWTGMFGPHPGALEMRNPSSDTD